MVGYLNGHQDITLGLKVHGEKSSVDSISTEQYKLISPSEYMRAINHITVLYCTNIPGTDKRKLLIVGKSANFRCFQELKEKNFQIAYHASKNVWKTS